MLPWQCYVAVAVLCCRGSVMLPVETAEMRVFNPCHSKAEEEGRSNF